MSGAVVKARTPKLGSMHAGLTVRAANANTPRINKRAIYRRPITLVAFLSDRAAKRYSAMQPTTTNYVTKHIYSMWSANHGWWWRGWKCGILACMHG